MGVDLGFEVDGNQQAQAIADIAALDMARYINIADGYKSSNPSITTYLNGKLANVSTDNSLNGGGATLSYAVGTWSSTGGWKAATGPCYAQLHTLNVPCTAVKVTATQTVPRIFRRRLGCRDSVRCWLSQPDDCILHWDIPRQSEHTTGSSSRTRS